MSQRSLGVMRIYRLGRAKRRTADSGSGSGGLPIALGGKLGGKISAGACLAGNRVLPGRSPSTACQKHDSARLPRGVPRRWRSASSSFATNQASSLGTSSVAR
jgi:hypothetical protein